MAQDRISYMLHRMREASAVADVVEAARALVETYPDHPVLQDNATWLVLKGAIDALYDAGYIELPDS